MTVKELKEKLEQFPENCIVMIPDDYSPIGYTPATHIANGVNEADGCVFLTDYVEEDFEEKEEDSPCADCVYEDADGSTPDISNCIDCSRICDFAKNDNYIAR